MKKLGRMEIDGTTFSVRDDSIIGGSGTLWVTVTRPGEDWPTLPDGVVEAAFVSVGGVRITAPGFVHYHNREDDWADIVFRASGPATRVDMNGPKVDAESPT